MARTQEKERRLVSVDDPAICRDCFDAAHFTLQDVGADRWQELKPARDAVGKLEGELYVRPHDDGNPSYSSAPCGVCASPLGGDRWQADVMQWQEKESK